MCIGYSSNAVPATKVSFLSPCKKIVQDPPKTEVVWEFQTSHIKKILQRLKRRKAEVLLLDLTFCNAVHSPPCLKWEKSRIDYLSFYLHSSYIKLELKRERRHQIEVKIITSFIQWIHSPRCFGYCYMPYLKIYLFILICDNKLTLSSYLFLSGSLSCSSHLQWEGAWNTGLGESRYNQGRWRLLHWNSSLCKMDLKNDAITLRSTTQYKTMQSLQWMNNSSSVLLKRIQGKIPNKISPEMYDSYLYHNVNFEKNEKI